MIKGQPTATVVQHTLKRLPLVRKRDFATMTTASEDPAGRKQQPMLHSQRVKQEEERQKTGEQARNSSGRAPYFPLGYKQAAYEWVCRASIKRKRFFR